jgi:ubiquitin-protein ligase E3 C
MLPVWGNERKRHINLGGASASTSQSMIIDQAKIRREERIEAKRRADAAIKVQSWWRGAQEAHKVRAAVRADLQTELSRSGAEAPVEIQTLRKLVVVGKNWKGKESGISSDGKVVLGMWSERVVASGPGMSSPLLHLICCAERRSDTLFRAHDSPSWLTLIKQLALLIIQAVANDISYVVVDTGYFFLF